MSQLLFILQSSPYQNSKGKDGIDAALVASAFGQDVSVLFSGDGVYQLIAGQNAALFGLKSTDKLIRSFDLYDIQKVYVDRTALEIRGLDASLLAIDAELLDAAALKALIQQQDSVMSF